MGNKYIDHRNVQIFDINATFHGVPRIQLMENAGRGVFEEIAVKYPSSKKVLLFCGPGNNGGDGLVAARYLLKAGYFPVAILVKDKMNTPEARKNLAVFRRSGGIVKLYSEDLEISGDIVVDALLGTGIKGELRGPIRGIVEKINSSDVPVVSVDVPTGTGGKSSVKADLVVTFHGLKEGLEGFRTVVKDIGIPPEAEGYVGPGNLQVNLKLRDPKSHKGEFGRAVIVGGSEKFHGAPVLSGLGAMNSGADLTFIAVPEANLDVTRSFLPDFIVTGYTGKNFNLEALDTVFTLSEKSQGILIGPGIGESEETRDAIFQLLEKIDTPAVIDADAIKLLKNNTELIRKKNVVLTPHKKEFEILTGKKLPEDLQERADIIKGVAKRMDCVILLKADTDIIASPDGLLLNGTGNPGMTVGGTGDVLAGLVTGFVSQGLSLFDAAACGAFLNGFAGDMLYRKKGYTFTASDLSEEIPYALRKINSL